MAVRILSPSDEVEFPLADPLVFRGRADYDVVQVTLETPVDGDTFDLGTVPVTEGVWTFSRRFNTGGKRTVVAEGLDSAGKVIGAATIHFTLTSEPQTRPLLPVAGSQHVDQAFKDRVVQIAKGLGTDPNFLMAVMSLESGGSFNPSNRNGVGSGAVGLIQFMPSTAHTLGSSTSHLSSLTALEQLDFVEQYFAPFKGRINSLEDCYMAVRFPAAVGKASSFVLFKAPSIAYWHNKGLDTNKDGKITKTEATARPLAILQEAGGLRAVERVRKLRSVGLRRKALVTLAARNFDAGW